MKIQYLSQYLDQATCEILIHSLVMSHLDYAKSILFGAIDKVIVDFKEYKTGQQR